MRVPALTEPAVAHRVGWPPVVKLYIGSFLVVGLSLCMLGPALTELRQRSGSGIGGIGILFAAQSVGYVTGSFVGGRLYDRHHGHRVYASALLVLAFGLCLVPLFDDLNGMLLAFVVIGLGASVTDLGANTLLLWELGANSDRAMNMLHLFFGIGALFAPLLVYVGLGIATLGAAAFCVVVAHRALRLPPPRPPSAPRREHVQATTPMLMLLCLFFVLYVGFEGGFGGWIKTYGVEVGFSDLAATWLTTTFWVGFTVGRLIASVVSNRVSPFQILASASAVSLLAVSVMLVGDGAAGAVWASTVLMGVGTAPQFAAMIMLAERRVPLDGRATSWFVGGAGLGGLIFPLMIGRVFDARGAVALPWAACALGLATCVAFLVCARALRPPRIDRQS